MFKYFKSRICLIVITILFIPEFSVCQSKRESNSVEINYLTPKFKEFLNDEISLDDLYYYFKRNKIVKADDRQCISKLELMDLAANFKGLKSDDLIVFETIEKDSSIRIVNLCSSIAESSLSVSKYKDTLTVPKDSGRYDEPNNKFTIREELCLDVIYKVGCIRINENPNLINYVFIVDRNILLDHLNDCNKKIKVEGVFESYDYQIKDSISEGHNHYQKIFRSIYNVCFLNEPKRVITYYTEQIRENDKDVLTRTVEDISRDFGYKRTYDGDKLVVDEKWRTN